MTCIITCYFALFKTWTLNAKPYSQSHHDAFFQWSYCRCYRCWGWAWKNVCPAFVRVVLMLTAETSYAQLFASRGANVVVNDVSKDAADKVVASITKGICQQSIRIASHTHVSQLEARPSRTLPLLQMEHQSYKQQLPYSVVSASSLTMLGYYGLSLKLLVLPYLCSLGQLGTEQRQEASPLEKNINRYLTNASACTCSFKNMSDQEWDMVQLVHLKGAFSCTKAAWPYFIKQKFGRVINTASAAGLYGTSAHTTVQDVKVTSSYPGNMGQSNYSAAKMGLVGFTKTLAFEGAKYGIKATVIAPVSFTVPRALCLETYTL